jgi:hypothetical protein
MIWIDNELAVLFDASLIKFFNDGEVHFWGANGWKKPRKRTASGAESFLYSSKEKAVAIWKEVDKQLSEEI